jgi:hypothetical protein
MNVAKVLLKKRRIKPSLRTLKIYFFENPYFMGFYKKDW